MEGAGTYSLGLPDCIQPSPTLFLWLCAVLCLVAQSCPTPCNHMDCSPPGSSARGILQLMALIAVILRKSHLHGECAYFFSFDPQHS